MLVIMWLDLYACNGLIGHAETGEELDKISLYFITNYNGALRLKFK